MKKISIYGIMILCLFTACKKDASLTASDYEKDYSVITDDPNDSVQHAIYLFYKDFGVPVYYKDTLGSEVKGTSVSGAPIIHYELLRLTYNPDATANPTNTTAYVYYQNVSVKANVMKGLRFLRTQLMPYLPAGVKPSSFFLTDTLYSNMFGTKAMKAYNTVAVGSVASLDTLSAANATLYRVALLRSILSGYVTASEHYTYLNTNFYGVSRSFISTGDIYNLNVLNILSLAGGANYIYGQPTSGNAASLTQFGFIGRNTLYTYRSPYYLFVYSPYTWMDVNMFIEAIFTYNTAQFTALYGSYATVMKKYAAMKKVITDLGFTLN